MKLFSDIVAQNPNLHGWCSPEKACALAAAVLTLRPTITVEIGVFGGRSFIPMAMTVKLVGRGTIFGIDPWSAPASLVGMTGANQEWWAKCDHDDIYRLFIEALNNSGARDVSVITRMRSNEVKLDTFPFIDLLHIDGNHGEEASLYDVNAFGSLVRVGGILFMDDIGWASKATERLYSLGFELLYKLDTGAMFQRVKKQDNPIAAL